MITPDMIPPPEEDDDDNPSPLAMLISSFIVDGLCQAVLALHLVWIFQSLGLPSFNALTFWISLTCFFVGLHQYNKKLAGRVFILQILLYILISVWIWIFV